MSACLVGKDWCDFLWSTWKLEWIYLWICSMLFSGVYDANSRRSYRCGHFKCLICLLFIVKMLYVVVGSGPGLVDGRVVVWSSALLTSTLYFHVHCCPLRHGWIGVNVEWLDLLSCQVSDGCWLLAVGGLFWADGIVDGYESSTMSRSCLTLCVQYLAISSSFKTWEHGWLDVTRVWNWGFAV